MEHGEVAGTFALFGHQYRFDGMTAQAETRVAKRLLGVFADVVPLVLTAGRRPQVRPDLDVRKVIQEVTRSLRNLSDEDQDFIERAALAALSRKEDGKWVQVWSPGAEVPIFEDINGRRLEQLTAAVLGQVARAWINTGDDDLASPLSAILQRLH